VAFSGASRPRGFDGQDLERTGVVVHARDSRVWVRCDAAAGCPACASGLGCRGGLLGALTGRPRLLEVDRGPHELAVGDPVRVAIPAAAINRAAVIVYGIPLTGLLLGAAAGAFVLPAWGDAAAVIGAVAGFAGGVVLARRRLTTTGLRPHLLTDRQSRSR